MTENKTIGQIMEQAQVFASAHALIDTRFDDGHMSIRAETEKDNLELLIRRQLDSVHSVVCDRFNINEQLLMKLLMDAHKLGFLLAASWVKRDDLKADTNSPLYIADRQNDLSNIYQIVIDEEPYTLKTICKKTTTV